jgi:hypothetical protein
MLGKPMRAAIGVGKAVIGSNVTGARVEHAIGVIKWAVRGSTD